MKFFKYMTLGAVALSMTVATSCVNDLDMTPDDPQVKTGLTTTEEWYGYFGSLYGCFLYEGNLSTSDGGAGTWMRCQWNLQEITADEAIISNKWNDPGYHALNFNTWLTDNEWVYASFSREFYTAKQCSEFINQSANAGSLVAADEMEAMKAEARVLRAYAYYYMIDLFGRGPWITEDTPTGSNPPTYDRKQLFDATVAELIDVIPHVRPAASQVYGRVSREAARMLLAKLYLNAEVYTGTPMYDKCAEQCKEILKTINSLAPTYKYLFCESNNKYVGNGEILWAIPQEVGSMQTWGGTTYMTAGAYIETADPMELAKLGCGFVNDAGELDGQSPWSGLRVRPELSRAFEDGDQRRLIYEGEFNEGIADLDNYGVDSDGYMCVKYTYTTEDDYENSVNIANRVPRGSQICNTDFPVFRLADTMLMLAECQMRGVADADPGYVYFNKVRARAGLGTKTPTSLNDILKERQCELYWEGHRRSDLIRFGLYTGGKYNWSWKGGVLEGASIDNYRALYAIPYQYVATVGQNPGY